jgi:flagellar biosynthesis protein FlhG
VGPLADGAHRFEALHIIYERIVFMPTIISVASGKGGVGKSSLVVNLSLRLQESYGPTLLVDSDLLMANSHILLNTQPNIDIVDVLEGHSEWRDAVHKVSNGLALLPGRTAANILLGSEAEKMKKLIKTLKDDGQEFDYIVVDTPAGSGIGVLDMLSVSDHAVILILGQSTSFVDAYALIKNAYLERHLTRFSTVVNMANSADQAEVIFEKFKQVVANFLPVELIYNGFLPNMADINKASIKGCSVHDVVAKTRIAAKMDTILKSLLATPYGMGTAPETSLKLRRL